MKYFVLRRFFIVDKDTNIIYSDFCENEKSIGIIDAIPSLLSNSSQFDIIDAENIDGTLIRKSIDRDVIEVPEFIKKKKQVKKQSAAESNETSPSQESFAWFFAFIAFLLSLLGIGKKQAASQ